MKSSFIIALTFPLFTISQQKPLSIGDTLPASIIASLPYITHPGSRISAPVSSIANHELQTTNYKTQTSNFEYPHRLIILDFFATFCTACIRELPKLDSLQQAFGKDLQIIIVAGEPLEKLNALKKKNVLFADCKLPIISGDSILKKYFPHQYLPHEIWLDQNGKVLAITDQYAITKENVSSFLQGKDPGLVLKSDAFEFNRTKPLLIDNNGGTASNLLFQTKLTNYLPGIASSTAVDRTNDHTRYAFINYPIVNLYKEAYGFFPNRLVIESNDSPRFLIPSNDTEDWKLQNLFSWEFIGPKAYPNASIQKMLAQDLDRYFNLNGHFEKRKTKCMALTSIHKNDSSLKTKSPKATVKYTEAGETLFTNQPFTKIIEALNTSRAAKPGSTIFIDETAITYNIDLSLPKAAKDDLQLLKKLMSAQGIQLIEVEREIEMFILSDNNKY